LLDADVTVPGTFGFDIPERGESLFKRTPSGDCGASGAKSQRSIQDVGVVSALGGIFSLQKDVGVRIDEAG
jgi:hypothetical protein